MVSPAMAHRAPRAKARALWRRVHLALGLALGGFFVLLGLTGSLLVFYVDLDAWLHPATQAGERAPLQAFTERLRDEFPSRNGPWRLELPADPERPLTARYYKPVERAHRDFAPLLVTLEPVSAEVLRERFWGEDLLTFVYDLHYTLLLDRPGRWMVGVLGLALLCSVSSGLWLWWPRHGQWRRALRVIPRDGAARAVYDLHIAGGVYGALLLLVLAVTGAVLALPEFIKPALAPLAEPPVLRTTPLGSEPISADAALAAAQTALPGGEAAWIEMPADAHGAWRVSLRLPGDPGRRFPHSHVWVDPWSGAVLHVRDARGDRAADVFLNWMHPLHSGEAFGLTGRLLVFVAGFIPLLLALTGYMRWRQKARVAKRRGPVGRASSVPTNPR